MPIVHKISHFAAGDINNERKKYSSMDNINGVENDVTGYTVKMGYFEVKEKAYLVQKLWRIRAHNTRNRT